MPGAQELLAPVKVNLFLEVLGKRPDGYHELFTVMETLDLGDRVRVEEAPELAVSADRADVPDGEANLAWRIVRAAEKRLGRRLPAEVAIAKAFPPGSGLGAGSSDAVAALKGVLRLHGVEAGEGVLREIASAVGSDTSFFVTGGTAVCRGRGEQIEPLRDAGARHYVLLPGAAPASTAEVYRAVDLEAPRRDGEAFVRELRAGQATPFNRLEQAAFKRYSDLRALSTEIERLVRRSPHLSGSGSAFFLLANGEQEATALARELAAATGLPALPARTQHS